MEQSNTYSDSSFDDPDNQTGKDVSKKTIVTLLVITILVVALGIWTVLDRMNAQSDKVSTTTGQVSMNIIPSNAVPVDVGNTEETTGTNK